MSCTTDCTNDYFTTTYTLSSDPITTLDFCRPMTYYVDANSEQVMELGTIEYPFRDINLVFVELNNQHQHTNRTIDIYVKEETKSYLTTDFIQIVNITQININSYTEGSFNDPNSIHFVLVSSMFDMHAIKSLFNLIQNGTISEIDTSRMEEHEIGDLTQQNLVLFHIHRSSISFNHVDVHSEFVNDEIEIWYIYTSY